MAHSLLHRGRSLDEVRIGLGRGCGHEGMIYRQRYHPSAIGLPLVGVTAHSISGGADKEVEVGACVGLLHVI